MSNSTPVFTGLFASLAISCTAMVIIPQIQLGGLKPVAEREDTGDPAAPGKIRSEYPAHYTSEGFTVSSQGFKVYTSLGCVYCHTQQIRDPQNGGDLDFGWAKRRTVARDYLFDSPPQLGTVRFGPDLSNVGMPDWRTEAEDDTYSRPEKRDRMWHLIHLYNPKAAVSTSNMPPYRFLFEKREKTGTPNPEAIPHEHIPADVLAKLNGYEIVPRPEARQLVDYLLSLNRSHSLPEATTPETPEKK